jgi:hypothetical protein
MADSTITGLSSVTTVSLTNDTVLVKQPDSPRLKQCQVSKLSDALQTGSRPMVDVTGTSKTLALTDAGTFQVCSNASAQTITVPENASVAFPVGTEIEFLNWGAGQVSFAVTGAATIQPSTTLKISARYKSAILKQITTNNWVLIGSLTS